MVFRSGFRIYERGSSIKREIIAGLTTFMTMAYIIFVNPAILAAAGLDFDATVVATCLGAGILTILMGVFTNYPFALASGMGLNAFLAYTVCKTMGYSWQTGMAVIFVEGVIIAILVLTRIREWVMAAIPLSLKHAIAVGIGLFIAVVGFEHAQIVTPVLHNKSWIMKMNELVRPEMWVSLIGLVVMLILLGLRVSGAIFLGLVITAFIAIPFGVTQLPKGPIVELPSFETAFGFTQGLAHALTLPLIPIIFAFLISDFFDTMGTVIGVGKQGNFLDERGQLPRLRGVLFIDSLGAVLGGAFSASSITTYIESAAGVAAGGRTGLTSIVVGLLFLIFLFFSPLAEMIGKAAITAPALIIVGFLMMRVIKDIPWDEFDEALPAFLTLIVMPLTFSISHGIGWGFISYTLIKLLTGKAHQLHPLMIIVSILFAISFSPLIPK